MRRIVSEATSEGGEDSVARYLHDFTQMVYKPKDDAETEVIDSATFKSQHKIVCPSLKLYRRVRLRLFPNLFRHGYVMVFFFLFIFCVRLIYCFNQEFRTYPHPPTDC